MLAAWDKDDDFEYRFVICTGLLMRVGTTRVGTTIEDEVRSNKLPSVSPWWKQTVDGQPLFRCQRDVRHDELNRWDETGSRDEPPRQARSWVN